MDAFIEDAATLIPAGIFLLFGMWVIARLQAGGGGDRFFVAMVGLLLVFVFAIFGFVGFSSLRHL